jgi:nitroimidazol reductase NimA-like FMN-containing flavoprotein (pyridoxamine 5'-phosphate oxidase superfamily)
VSEEETWRGKIGAMSPEDVNEFLEEPHLARVACLDANGWPTVVPMWHQWDGRGFWVVGREKSEWAGLLERDPRCALTIDEESLGQDMGTGRAQRRFVAQCTATVVERPNVGGRWVEIARAMSLRYYGENGPKYLEPTLGWKRWLIRLDPVRTMTWQGIGWPRRYLEGTPADR